jgi:hypothetical protein
MYIVLRSVQIIKYYFSFLHSAVISCSYLVDGTIFGGKNVFDTCSDYFMHNFSFSAALSIHKEFSEILHIQARIYVKQNYKLFLPKLKHISIGWANFSFKNNQLP